MEGSAQRALERPSVEVGLSALGWMTRRRWSTVISNPISHINTPTTPPRLHSPHSALTPQAPPTREGRAWPHINPAPRRARARPRCRKRAKGRGEAEARAGPRPEDGGENTGRDPPQRGESERAAGSPGNRPEGAEGWGTEGAARSSPPAAGGDASPPLGAPVRRSPGSLPQRGRAAPPRLSPPRGEDMEPGGFYRLYPASNLKK